MSRPRKHDSGLPPYVRVRNGSYLYRDAKLCRVRDGIGKMYEELAKRLQMPEADTIPAALLAFKAEYIPTLSASSQPEAKRRLDKFLEEFRRFKVPEVRPSDVRLSIKNLYTGKPGAAGHYKALVSRFFNWCVLSGLRDDNPCREVEVRKGARHKSKWTDELFIAVRDKLSPMHQCYVDLSVLLYQRTTDVRRLKRSQIQDGVIRFEPTKTLRSSGAEVDVPITPAIQKVLDRAAEVSKEWKVVCPFVIHTRQGTAYTRSGVYSAIIRAAGGNGTGLNPKDLRPYAASRAKQLGYSLEQLKVGLAHTSVTTTEGYVQQHTVPVSQVILNLPERKK